MLKHSAMSDSLQPHGLQSKRLLCPWSFPGKNTGVGCHALLQGIFLTQGSNLHLLCLLARRFFTRVTPGKSLKIGTVPDKFFFSFWNLTLCSTKKFSYLLKLKERRQKYRYLSVCYMRRLRKRENKEHFPDAKWSTRNRAGYVRRGIKRLREHREKLRKIPKDVSELLKRVSKRSAVHDRTGKQDMPNPHPRRITQLLNVSYQFP